MRKKIGMIRAMKSCREYPKLDSDAREKIRKQRLEEVVSYAKKNSAYYGRLYENIDKTDELAAFPVVTKAELMEHYDEWCTDPEVSFSDVKKFLSDRDNLGSKFAGKYHVHTTSGSTGIPLILLSDASQTNVMNAISLMRAIPSAEIMKEYVKKGGRSMGVYADNGFYLGNGSIHAKLKAFPWKKKQIGLADALLPIEKIVERLNDFKPVMLGGYPSNLEMLIGEVKSGKLRINPVLIMTGGEYLSKELRAELSDTFHCPVYITYACTEGGTIACECNEGHMHINEDWMYIEAVDRDNKPVADGELSDKILLTNLSNYTQPLIRYEVTDRVRIHHEGCSCGNPSPWLEIEGRTDDIVTFTEKGRDIHVAPLAIYACLKNIHEIRRFQVFVSDENRIELRLLPFEDYMKEKVFEKAEKELKIFLQGHGISEVHICLSNNEPRAGKNGKYKHVIMNR